MYARTGKLGRISQLARTNRLSGVRGLRGGMGQDEGSSIDWGTILNNTITTAGAVAAKAVTPPTYSSVINPMTGQQSITSYAPTGMAAIPGTSLLGSSALDAEFGSLLSSPLIWMLGIGLIAVLALKR